MAVDNWPSTLPDRFQSSSYGVSMADGRIRSEMDSGPAKVRRRSSAMPAPLSGVMYVRPAQIATIRAFVKNNLLGGSLAFRFPDPLTRELLLVRFVELPSWSCVSGDIYSDNMNLEILP